MDRFNAAAVKQRVMQAKYVECRNMQKSELCLKQKTERDASNLEKKYHSLQNDPCL